MVMSPVTVWLLRLMATVVSVRVPRSCPISPAPPGGKFSVESGKLFAVAVRMSPSVLPVAIASRQLIAKSMSGDPPSRRMLGPRLRAIASVLPARSKSSPLSKPKSTVPLSRSLKGKRFTIRLATSTLPRTCGAVGLPLIVPLKLVTPASASGSGMVTNGISLIS